MTWALFPGDKYARAAIELITASLPMQGSERVVAVVGGALLEESVGHTLRERLINEPRLVDNLLGVDRPLGNMGPKIDLLRLLGAFDEKTRGALKGIASVRNFFAHHMATLIVPVLECRARSDCVQIAGRLKTAGRLQRDRYCHRGRSRPG